MTYSTIQIDRKGRVGIITLNRPSARNAINRQMVTELADAAATLNSDESIHAVILTGSGPSFCAGLDLKEPLPKTLDELQAKGFGDREALARLRKPVIAAVSGAAIGGGCELALMSDIIIGDATTRFSQPEVLGGGMPGAGGTQRLAEIVGRMRASEICMTGRIVAAEEALRLGLLLEIVEGDRLQSRALELADKIATPPSHVTAMIKEAISASQEVSLSQGLAIERRLSYSCIAIRNAKSNQ